jgi:predicted phosphoribosyltransferase
LAAGAAMQAALAALREQRPAHLIIALPMVARTTRETIEHLSEEIVCASVQPPEPSLPEGIWDEDSRQPTAAEVRKIIADPSRPPLLHPAETQTNRA